MQQFQSVHITQYVIVLNTVNQQFFFQLKKKSVKPKKNQTHSKI